MPIPLPARLRPLVLLACAACGPAPASDAVPPDPAARADSAPVAVAGEGVSAPAVPASPDSASQAIRGVRTSLDDCTTVSVDEESGGATRRCPGTAGYSLLALDGDARMSVTLIDAAGREHPLDYWTTVTGAFSSLGEAAEWRVRGEGASAVPVALIVPLLANEDPDDPERVVPYRVIAKITPSETCVTHRLPGDTPDAEARRLADASAAQPCRTSYPER